MRSSAICLTLAIAGCSDGGEVYTLYRDNARFRDMRIHVATFDADEGGGYNLMNCNHAVDLYLEREKAEGKTTRYWCERGRFKE